MDFLPARVRWLPKFLVTGFLLDVPAKLKPHRGQNLRRELIFAAGREPLEQGCGQNRRGRGGFYGREYRPAALAGVRYAAGETLERWLLQQGNGGQIEQPRSHHTSPAPDFRDVRQV